ncbi:X-ray repair cross-complementing protein 5-like [Anopheles merus]|uniref:Ku domain-containing protein n=1 Tax=Anopheles merus TaxID=30066 RepID=A0A182ULU3_ANOME|nr:X-ray repair cross-complementing protein 5-like [Anopheles merus]XP_041774830.1 X-ray repair cross-complementing protein 5-like [Anopheles merus]XP_041774831.1 X-ray repair cross-complementing protein 5-like [Anopheles merus]XP_041774833.1 X-ray repair cross-complementing protein 5-like [Anopheles merus]
MSRAIGKAHMIVLDVGRSCAIATGRDKQSFFDKAKTCASLIVQRLIFSAPNDHVGIVLFGTDETNNQLNVDSGGYENITEAFELKPPNWQTLRILQNQVVRTESEAGWFDALIVATNFLRNGALGKKFTGYSIILLSPLFVAGDIDQSQLDSVADGISNMLGVLHVITNYVLHPAASVATIFTTTGTFDEQASKTEARTENERYVRQILDATDGTLANINWAERMLTFFDAKAVRPTPWNSTLTIGTKVKLSISAYYIVCEQKGLGSFKVDSVDDAASRVEMRTQYFLNDKPAEISMQDIIMGYMYGSTVVPYDNTIDIEYKSGDCRLACLGFTASNNILEEHLSGKGSHVVVAKKGCGASNQKLCALVKAMYELNVVMIATKVYRKDTKPRLNALIPTYKHGNPCLVMLELIFKDELCSLKFPSLLKSSKNKPTNEQYDAIDKLIDNMNLMDAVDDSNGECREAFALNSTFNPTLQHVYLTVAHRALNPKQPLPGVNSTLQELIDVPKKVLDRSKAALDDVRKAFELKEIKQNTRAEWLQRMAKIKVGNYASSSSSSTTIDSGVLMDEEADDGSDDANRRMVVSVGTVTPAEDFALLLRRGEKFATVATQLQNAVFELLFTSMRPPGSKVIAALLAYRSEAQKLGPYRYNEWMTEFKEMLLTRQKADFWETVIVGEKLGLIDSQESEMSTVSVDQAANFYKTPTQNKMAVESSDGDYIDPDCLFDELNGSF